MRTFKPGAFPPFERLPSGDFPVPSGGPVFALKDGDRLGAISARTCVDELWWQLMISVASHAQARLYYRLGVWHIRDIFNGLLPVEYLVRPKGHTGELKNFTVTAVETQPQWLNHQPTDTDTANASKDVRSFMTLAQSCRIEAQLHLSGRGQVGTAERIVTAYFRGTRPKDGTGRGRMGLLLGEAPPEFKFNRATEDEQPEPSELILPSRVFKML